MNLLVLPHPSGLMLCGYSHSNPVYVQPGELCADGSFWITIGYGHCEKPVPACPNSSWALSEDQKICSRPDFSCIINPSTVSEQKLLAAIAYGEASTLDNFEEMAAIAHATLRRRDAAHLDSVQDLIKKYSTFSYAVTDGNARYRKLMCSESETDFEKAYEAANNALSGGYDYANGGCFWDGYDLKTSSVRQYKYRSGFKYSDPSHNIFSTPEPNHLLKREKDDKRGIMKQLIFLPRLRVGQYFGNWINSF